MSREAGIEGEDIAAEILVKNNYEVIERNFHSRAGEIDIIAKEDGVTVFVEVKYRKDEGFGAPEEYVTRSKINKILKTAKLYLYENDLLETDWRIDVVAIDKDTDLSRVIKNVYMEGINFS